MGTCTGSMPATIRTSSKYISTLGLKKNVKNDARNRPQAIYIYINIYLYIHTLDRCIDYSVMSTTWKYGKLVEMSSCEDFYRFVLTNYDQLSCQIGKIRLVWYTMLDLCLSGIGPVLHESSMNMCITVSKWLSGEFSGWWPEQNPVTVAYRVLPTYIHTYIYIYTHSM